MNNFDLKSQAVLSTVKNGNLDELKKLLESEGLNLDDAKNNCLALIHAIKANDVEIVKLLLDKGCTVNQSDADIMFDTPIDHAIEHGNLEIIELLLEAGASVTTNSNATTSLYKAMIKQKFDVVDLMLSRYDIKNIDPNNKQEFVYFVIACIRNSVNVVEQFINKGTNVNGTIDDCANEWAGYTPLYLSVKYLSVEVVNLLLWHGADFTFQDKNGNSPLHLAYYVWISMDNNTDETEKASDIMNLILVAHTKNIKDCVNNKGLSHFLIACMGRNAPLVHDFLQSGIDVNSPLCMVPQISAATVPLHLAVENCQTDIVKTLLEHHADVDAKDSNGHSSLQIALQNKLYEIAELLLEFKAVVHTENIKIYDEIFKAFLDYPRTGQIVDMMFLACQENIANSVNSNGLSLLHVACTRNNIDIINKLLLTTSDVNACVHEKSSVHAGYTALHFAASALNLEAIHVLLEHQADVNVLEGRGLSPLWLSIRAQPQCILIENVIKNEILNELESIDKEQMIISVFNEFKYIEVVELLVGNRSNLDYKNKDGTPLLIGAYQSLVSCFESRFRYLEDVVSKMCNKYCQESGRKIMSCLIEHGIDLNVCDEQENHILHYIAYSLKNKTCTDLAIEAAEMVLRNGANVNVSNVDKNTPLHIASRQCLKFFELLLKFDAHVEATNKFLETPLHTAAKACSADSAFTTFWTIARDENHERTINTSRNSLKILECLLRSNSNVNAQDANGETPLFIAATGEDTYCVKLLLDYGADIDIKNENGQSVLVKLCAANQVLPFRFIKVVKALVWHMLKLLTIGHPTDHSNLPRCERKANGKFQFYCRTVFICEEDERDSIMPRKYTAVLRDEVRKLKDAKIDNYNSLYDVLRKNVQQMTQHVKNKTLEDHVGSENLSTRFPNYGYLLKLKFKDGLARNAILEKAKESFKFVTRSNLLDFCVDMVFSYISNKDMNNLILAVQ